METFCHHQYFKRRIVCSCGHPGTFHPAVITNKEAHMAYGNMNKGGEASHTANAGKKRSSHKISDYFSKGGKPNFSG